MWHYSVYSLPKIKRFGGNVIEYRLLLILDRFFQEADRLRTWNLDRKYSAWIISRN
jgi:hypothetical protein